MWQCALCAHSGARTISLGIWSLPLQLMTSLPVVVLDNGGSTIKANVVLNGDDDNGVTLQPRCVFSAASCSCTINRKEIFK